MAIIKSLSDQVYEYVFHMIKVGKIAVGDKIDEAELIKKLGISRTPIREALIQMTSDNLLDNVPRKGFFVKSVDEVEMNECFAVIAQLDAYAMELAMPNIEKEHIQRMATAVDKMSLAISKADEDMYYDWEQEFHTVYRDVCGNNVLTNMIRELTRKAFRSEAFTKSTTTKENYWKTVNGDHERLVEAVEKRDVEAAKECLREHWVG
ncbi:MAG: GntR family transcriptional regulator [Firmicutes bacterium]|nr:GntR family transcriptional regulator [Bacillota bacterium]